LSYKKVRHIHDSREESSLESTEEKTAGYQGAEAADESGEDGHNTPEEDKSCDVSSRLHLLDDEVGRCLE
jgi:hypothetical protein